MRLNIKQDTPKTRFSILCLFVICAIFITICAIPAFFTNNKQAQADSSDINLFIDPFLNVRTTTSEFTIPIAPSPVETLYSIDVPVFVATNNITGYTLVMSTEDTSNNSLINAANNNYSIPSTNNSIAGPLSVNTWGYNIKTSQSEVTDFLAIPTSPSTQIDYFGENTIGERQTTVTIGAKVNLGVTAGYYSNTLVFTAIAEAVPHSPYIESISPTTNMTGGDIFISGNGFYGSDEQTTDAVTRVTVGGTDCSSFKVIDSETIKCVLPYSATDSTYAVVATTEWSSNANKTVTYDSENKGYMQNVTPTVCGSMPMGLTQIYTDQRVDTNTGLNHQYRVKKMQDGKCWMIDNLKFGWGTIITASNALTTNGEWGSQTVEESTANIDVAKYIDPSVTGAQEGQDYCIDASNALAGSTTKCGYLYNWYTATYGTGTYELVIWNPAGSICPNTTNPGEANSTPWRLSTGRGAAGVNEFSALDIAMGGNGTGSSDLSYLRTSWSFSGSWSGVLAGRNTTFMGNQGVQGYWWTKTSGYTGVNQIQAARFYLSSSDVSSSAAASSEKYMGAAVRCLMDSL